jgi:hypothetical protein
MFRTLFSLENWSRELYSPKTSGLLNHSASSRRSSFSMTLKFRSVRLTNSIHQSRNLGSRPGRSTVCLKQLSSTTFSRQAQTTGGARLQMDHQTITLYALRFCSPRQGRSAKVIESSCQEFIVSAHPPLWPHVMVSGRVDVSCGIGL